MNELTAMVDHTSFHTIMSSYDHTDSSPVRFDPNVMGGGLVFRATRVPAQTLLDYLADGFALDEFLEMFPSVNCEDTTEFLRLVELVVRKS